VRYPQTQNPLYPSQNPPRGYSDVGGAYPQNPQNPPRGYSGSTYPTPSGKSTYPQNPRQDPREYPQRGYREDPLSVYARGEYPQQNSPNAYGAYGDGGYPSRDPRGYGAYSPPPQRYGYPRTDSDYLRRFEEIVSEYNYGRGRAPVPYNRYQY
jgi:hypothetical protein